MLRSFVLLAVLTLAWGINWSVLKIGVEELPPFWFRGLSLLIGTALLGLMVRVRGTSLHIPRASIARVLGLAIPNIILWYGAATEAITMLPAGRAAILGFTMPIWSMVIGTLVYREPREARTTWCVVAAAAGLVLLVAGDRAAMVTHPLGIALMLFAAVSWAWGTHLFKRSTLGLDTLVLTFWMMAFSVPVILGISALGESARWRPPRGHEWWPILYSAVLVLAVGNVLWFSLARRLPATTAGLSSMLIPVVGVFSGMALLDESPSWRDWVALAMICGAVGATLKKRAAT
jgi:drug/metabolite transporter (DMT)-like permease